MKMKKNIELDLSQDIAKMNLKEFKFTSAKELMKDGPGEIFKTETAFDKLFKAKGIKAGEIIEISACHHVGKTYLVNSLALNLLTKYPDTHISFIVKDCDAQIRELDQLIKLRGHDESSMLKFFNRIHFFEALNLSDFMKALKKIIYGQQGYHNIYNQVSFLFIDSFSWPWLHTSEKIKSDLYMIQIIHSFIYELAKKLKKVVVLTNKLRGGYTGKTVSAKHSDLENYWNEILDKSITMTCDDSEAIELFEFFNIKKRLEVSESHKSEMPQRPIILDITNSDVHDIF